MSVGVGGGIFPVSAGGGGAGGLNLATDTFVPAFSGETSYTLTLPYVAGGLILALVNTNAYDDTSPYFTAVGTAFEWLDKTFILDPDDCLVVIYETP